jgi:predicted nucleic acid-binding Zn ribbon protein
MTRDRDQAHDEPRPLHDALAEVSADLGLPEPDAFRGLVTNWQDLVGRELAAHCRLRSLRDGVLHVSVDDAPWATQLRYLEADVVARGAALVGPGVVRALRVSVAAPGATEPSADRGPGVK